MTLLSAQEKECMVNPNITKFKSVSQLLAPVFVTNTNEESRESINKNSESIKQILLPKIHLQTNLILQQNSAGLANITIDVSDSII